ncbi:hypothetical protein ATEIFO6365_0011038000 [Aspergillus terreus]|uniref:Uncharacterized protein n=1 Tax=Aspergillus terreus TaxID=33178 RepID=A0A5M3YZF9_ASPTE|nr:hypothetical protein ATETN484_0006052200 [Aspergillus terreus]GFF20118.1 hypothetical protein ATEIFO6365_0011038000 [Aspergillus terreus]
MRTRSQQASPGGFVSLDSERATRRTRSTRTASQSNTEPSTSQTTTRSKNQRAAKKPAPKKTTTTTTKTQTRKGTTRTTRKTTRKTTQTAPSDEAPETHNAAADENIPPNDSESIDQAHDSSKDSEPTAAPKPGLSEPNNSERESSTPSAKDPKETITLAVPPAVAKGADEARQPPFPQAPSPRSTIGTSWLEYLENISDIGSPLSERSRTPSVDSSFALEGEVDEDLLAQVSEALARHNAAQPDVPTGEDRSTSELAEVGPTTTELEPANTPARVVSTESSCSATVVVSVEESAAVDELEALAERFSKLSLTCVPAVVSSTESPAAPTWRSETQQPANETSASPTTDVSAVVSDASVDPHRLASIYNDAPPQFPYTAWQELYPPRPAVEDQQSPSTIFGGPIPSGPSSIFDDERQAAYYLGRQSIVEGPLVSETLAEAPELIAGLPSHPAEAEPGELFRRPSTPALGFWPRGGRTRLSPIPEEPEEPETSPAPGSSAGVEQEGSACTPAPLLAPSPVPMVDPQAPAHGPAQVPSAVSPTPPKKTKGKKKTKTKPLTSSKVNRKRSRSETGDERAPETPIANKRRNLGPPGSTPFARRLTPLSRRLSTNAAPYSERLRRRTIESQGRIHRTVFRIPQLIAQTEADRRASESASPSPFPGPPETTFDFTVERNQENDQTSQSEPSAQQEPSTPDSSRRGWNIRGLLSSVPRSLSISRFLPFGRSPRTAESSAAPQPSSERINRTQPLETDMATSQRETQPRRRVSESHLAEEPPKKRTRNMSYSLFPAPIDRSLYLGDIPKTKPAPKPSSEPESQQPQKQATEEPKVQESTVAGDEPSSERESRGPTTSETAHKKRKRAPSPDVIPNPKGSSYGMDLDYFCYSSDSDEESHKPSQQSEAESANKLPLAQKAVRSALRSERHPSKKVRFDASPEDTPSKLRLRARATDPYQGRHFIGMGEGSPSTPASAPTTPTPADRTTRPPGFIPNTQGTFQLDYDALSDDSESSGAPSPSAVTAPSPAPSETPSISSTQVVVGDRVPEHLQPAPLTPRVPPPPPSTPATNKEALERARSQAEKYKPKTPSGLQTVIGQPPQPVQPSQPSPAVEAVEKFGDDQYARDAQWLYENCPSGDLSKLSWPARQSLSESLGTSPATLELVNEIITESEIEEGYKLFCEGLRQFEQASA